MSPSGDASRAADSRPRAGRVACRRLGTVARRRPRALEVVEDAYVLCEGGAYARSATCGGSAPLDGEVEEVDGRGLSAVPGLVDCHTHACFAGDRVEEFALRAAGRATRSCTPPAAGSSRPSARRAPPGRRGSPLRSTATWAGCCVPERRRSRRSRATGSTGRPSSHSCARSAPQEASRPGSARTPSRPSSPTRGASAYVDFLVDEVLPDAARSPRPRTSSSSAGAFGVEEARRYLDGLRGARSRAPPARRPVHGVRRDPARDRARRALGRPSREHRPARDRRARRERRRRRAPAGERALPRPPDATGARARRRGRGDRARDRLQPRQRVLREPAARLLARVHAAPSVPGGGARGLHRERRPRALARPTGRAGSRPDTTPTSSSSRRRTGVISRTTWAARSSTRSSEAGGSPGAARHNRGMPTRKQRRRRAKELRHEYVWEDEEGNELDPDEVPTPEEPTSGARRRAPRGVRGASRNRRRGAAR